MRSAPKVISAAVKGASEKKPLVVIQTWSRMVRLTVRDRCVDGMRAEHRVATVHHRRQAFAHVADDDLQLAMTVERAGKHQPQRVDRDLLMPAPAGQRQQPAGAVRQVVIVGLAHRLAPA